MTWDNGAATSQWNTTDVNWTGAVWNNANGDGAIFGSTGVGAINVTAPMNVNSLDFTSNGYTLSGSALNFVTGTSTAGTGVINTSTTLGGATVRNAEIDNAINSSVGLQKLGAGTLTLGGALNFSGPGVFLGGGNLFGDLVVAGNSSSGTTGGTLAIANGSVVPSTARVGISNGLLDIGSNNVTLSQLTFQNNANTTVAWNPATGVAAAGVEATGGGTLTVTGEINVLGNSGGSTIQSIGANLNLNGGTQIIRTELATGISNSSALQIAGVISNGSLFKSYGFLGNGTTVVFGGSPVVGAPDGMALYGNNTYTGSTVINGGNNIITGTNATSAVTIAGPGGAGFLTLQGANGSLGSATTILAENGATFQIDNTAALTSGGSLPNIPAAQNNDRIGNSTEIQLRNGTFAYKGAASTAATETFGNLNVLDGANTVSITPGASGSVALTASGSLLMGSRATLALATAAGNLGNTAQLFVTGTAPTTDATGLVDRVYTGSTASNPTDFVTYSPVTGLTPLAAGSYSSTYSAGTNVLAPTGTTTVSSSVNVNAIKSAGTGTTTIANNTTLGISSGMILSAGFGTRTFAGSTAGSPTGATLDFGSAPGSTYGTVTLGTVANPIAITGSAGIINSVGTLTISAGDDLSGLTGDLTNNGTTNLNTNSFAGTMQVRSGTLNINTSLGAGGAITIGIPENDSNLVGLAPSLNTSGAGINSSIARDITFNNGGLTAAGATVARSFQPSLSVLGNTTANGTQTFSGNITVDSPGFITGGSPNLTNSLGSTNFTGNVSGPSSLTIQSDRATLSGNFSNAGGFIIGGSGNTQVTLTSASPGSAPIFLEDNGSAPTGANFGAASGNSFGTQLRYNSGTLPTGTITTENYGGTALAAGQLVPLQNSTINNAMVLNGPLVGNVGQGISATWSGPMSGSNGPTNSSPSSFTKIGAGTLILSGANTYAGTTTVGNGTLTLDYSANNSSHLADGAALVFGGTGGTGGGTLNLSGGSHTEVVASTTLNAGSYSVTQTSGSSVLQMGAITRSAGGTINVGADSIATTDTSNLNGNGILGGYATVGATTGSADWAKSVNSGAAATAITAFTTYDSFATSGTDNNNPLLTGSSALAGNLTTNSLKINSSGAGQALDLGSGQTMTLNSGGLMYVGADDYQINNGTLKSGTATNSDLIVQQYGAGTLTVNSVIANGNGASTLTKAGSGTLALANTNTYTGTTYVDGGTLLANNATSSTGSGAVTVNTGGTLGGTGKVVGAVTVNTGGTLAGTGITLGSTVTVNSGGTFAGTGTTATGATGAVTVNPGATIAPGNIGGIGTLNTGNINLSGANFLADINLNNGGPASADLLNVTGTVNVTGATLTLQLGNVPLSANTPETFIIAQNDASDAVTGTFANVTGNFQSATVIYNFNGTDALGQVGTGNDIAVTVVAVPEPSTFAMLAFGAVALFLNWRRRTARKCLARA